MMKLVVLSCALAAVSGSLIAPFTYGAPYAYNAPFAYSANLAYAAPYWTPSNYRGPLSLAPGQPADILGSDGRPLDTLDVNLDRTAHYTAKALKSVGVHVLKKRSAALFAPSPFYSPLTYGVPITYAAPYWTPSNYRGPLSLAPGQPADILASDGRPLDTLDVNLDRSAHFTAKALKSVGIHVLKKRAAEIVAPAGTVVAPTPLIAHGTPVIASGSPIAYAASPAIATPIIPAAPIATVPITTVPITAPFVHL